MTVELDKVCFWVVLICFFGSCGVHCGWELGDVNGCAAACERAEKKRHGD